MKRRFFIVTATALLFSAPSRAEITGLFTQPAGISSGAVQLNIRGLFGADNAFYYSTNTQTLHVQNIDCPGCSFGGMSPGASYYVQVDPASPQSGGYIIERGSITTNLQVGDQQAGDVKLYLDQAGPSGQIRWTSSNGLVTGVFGYDNFYQKLYSDFGIHTNSFLGSNQLTDCPGFLNGGKLTADINGVIDCADDISGSGGGLPLMPGDTNYIQNVSSSPHVQPNSTMFITSGTVSGKFTSQDGLDVYDNGLRRATIDVGGASIVGQIIGVNTSVDETGSITTLNIKTTPGSNTLPYTGALFQRLNPTNGMLRNAIFGLRDMIGEDPYFFVDAYDNNLGVRLSTGFLHVNVSTHSSSKGFVGIGVSTPIARLDVGGTVRVLSTFTVVGSTLIINGSTNYWNIGQGGAGQFVAVNGGILTAATPAGGGTSFSMAVTTGSFGAYTGPPMSSSSVRTLLVFDTNTVIGSVTGTTTFFFQLNSASVTLSGAIPIWVSSLTTNNSITLTGTNNTARAAPILGVNPSSVTTSGQINILVASVTAGPSIKITGTNNVLNAAPIFNVDCASATCQGPIVSSLTAVNQAAGSYTNSNITINSQGQVTAASNGSSGSSGPNVNARVFNSTGPLVPASATLTLLFDKEDGDTDNIHSLVSNTSRLTANTAGHYSIFATVETSTPTQTAKEREAFIMLNGSTVIARYMFPMTNSATQGGNIDMTLSPYTQIDLLANDYVEVKVTNWSATADITIATRAVFGMSLMTGPAVGAAFSLAITTGSFGAFTGNAMSSSTVRTLIVLDTNTLTNSVTGGTTNFFGVNCASVTCQGPIVSSFPASGVVAGTFGSATQIATFTVNAQGMVTKAGNIDISYGWVSKATTTLDMAGYGISNIGSSSSSFTGAGGIVAQASVTINQGMSMPPVIASADYIAKSTDGVIIGSSSVSGNTTRFITLPAASANKGQIITVTKMDISTAAVCVRTASSTDLIANTTTQIFMYAPGQSIELISDGNNAWLTRKAPSTPAFLGDPGDPNTTATVTASTTYCGAVTATDFLGVVGVRFNASAQALQSASAVYQDGILIATSNFTTIGTGAVNIFFNKVGYIHPGQAWVCFGSQSATTSVTRKAASTSILGTCSFATTLPYPTTQTFKGCTLATNNYTILGLVGGGIP